MRVKDLERLYDYSYWVNKKLFEVISRLSDEEFTRQVAGSYGSIRNTLVHVMSAEWGWLDRCGGPARGPKLEPSDYPNATAVFTRWSTVERQMREFLSALTDDDLDREVEFGLKPTEKHTLTVRQLLQHGVNHNAHHRGQVALILRELGYSPGNFDLVIYDIERAQAARSQSVALGR
jgi:uncharacterized damage-inducible protein DinB